ncbi:MAG: hypothetical protein ACXVDH_02720 [Nocardioides sp.]|uniref:hypothetical protein n=1 Tax=Nocardioides nematodiphilus TaxID=2849669 RepID=UPI001CD92DFF|nr:hypothetical protein [Nocardioides nematodiphilus]MCA1981787.1 hypothetical protein [Nocardioides nematodiphilus]
MFRHLLGIVLGLALTALVVIPVTAAVVSSAEEDTPHGSVTAGLARDLTTPAADVPDRCHGTGALIRTHGRIHQVSLARGLRTYEHKAPGTFLSLCPRGDATPQGS